MAIWARESRRKLTYDLIREETGLSKNTLARLANDRGDLVALNTVDRLCAFFGCQPGDLFIYVPTLESGAAGQAD
jgi:putative transcriptional regulator